MSPNNLGGFLRQDTQYIHSQLWLQQITQTSWLNNINVLFQNLEGSQKFTIGLTELDSMCCQSCLPSWRLRGKSISLSFLPSRGCLHSLASGLPQHLQSQQRPQQLSHDASSLVLTLLGPSSPGQDRVITPGYLGNPEESFQSHLISNLTSICSLNSPRPCNKAYYSQVLNQVPDMCLGGYIISPIVTSRSHQSQGLVFTHMYHLRN